MTGEDSLRIIQDAFDKDIEAKKMSRMNLKCLFVQRDERYAGKFAPELVLAWDEYAVEDNPGGFEQDVERNLKQLEQEIMGHAIVTIEVDQDLIRKRCMNDVPPVVGEIKAI